MALPIVLGLVALLAYGSEQASAPLRAGRSDRHFARSVVLPFYAMRTVLRMAMALVVSFLFSLAYAATASKKSGRLRRS